MNLIQQLESVKIISEKSSSLHVSSVITLETNTINILNQILKDIEYLNMGDLITMNIKDIVKTQLGELS